MLHNLKRLTVLISLLVVGWPHAFAVTISQADRARPVPAVAAQPTITHPEQQQVAEVTYSPFPHIVSHKDYDISFMGFEKLHPFDAAKYGKVYRRLCTTEGKGTPRIPKEYVHKPVPVTDEQLRSIHTPRYLASLNDSTVVARITEIAPVQYLPNYFVRSRLLYPMKLATGGTILATQLALKHGWAINLSGGYHHAKADGGEGFCVYADIPIAVNELWKKNPNLKVMIVDLDAHQGNGFESIFKNDKRVTMFDVYNGMIYPNDRDAQQYITHNFPVSIGIRDQKYLELIKRELPKAIEQAQPDLIIYNAGTDPFEEDPLGAMKISAKALIERDEFVVSCARANKIPIAMVLSGGYTKKSAEIIGGSIENMLTKWSGHKANVKQGYPAGLTFDRIKMSQDQAMYRRDDRDRVEGYWATDENPEKDSYRGQFPFPMAYRTPWPGKKEFLAKLRAIEALVVPHDVSNRIGSISCKGPAHSRLEKNVWVGSAEFIDRVEHIRWPKGYSSHYIDKHNVIPSREFYDYVMSFKVE